MKHNPLRGKRVIYVNFAPYTNAGKILDFLNDNAALVVSFMFNYHRLSADQDPGTLTVYRRGRVVLTRRLFQTPTTEGLAWILLPIRSAIIFIQLLFYTWSLRRAFGPFDVYFTVNAFTAWAGNVLKHIGLVGTTLFWVWDYYPPVGKNMYVSVMRWIYWQFDKSATLASDRIVFLNRKLEILRKEIGLLPETDTYDVVGIGTDPRQRRRHGHADEVRLVFLGVVKDSQGLELLMRAAPSLSQRMRPVRLDVIGTGPGTGKLKALARGAGISIRFHDFVKSEQHVDAILSSGTIGVAPYVPEKDNVSYYTDPSKIKRYLSAGLPVVTTDVFAFSEDIRASGAGEIIEYTPEALIAAIGKINRNYKRYAANATSLARRLDYRRIYPSIFERRTGRFSTK